MNFSDKNYELPKKKIKYVNKKILLFVAVLFFTSLNYAQKTPQNPLTKVDSMLVHIDKKALNSGILYERVVSWAALDEFNNSKENVSSPRHFEQALNELYKASNKQKFINYRDLRKKYTNEKFQNIVDVGIINATFQMLNYNPESKEPGGLALVNGVYQPIKGKAPFLTKHILVVSPLKKYVVGQKIVFNFDKSFFFEETKTKKILNLTADFGTKKNYSLISKSMLIKQSIPVAYRKTGDKTIVFTAQFSDGTSVTTKAKIHVKVINSTLRIPDFIVSDSIVSTIPFQGYDESAPILGQIEYRIFYDKVNNNMVLNKPIVIIDGFDPLDKRKIQDSDPHPDMTDDEHESIEDMMIYFKNGDKQFIIKELRDLGYDVIIVNHPVYNRTINGVVTQIDGGADYIERNAMAHIALYQRLNSKLAQNGSTEQLVIVGPSMGGQISRYALAYMEKNNIPHNTRLWVSVDSPHLGANIPLGVQSLVNMIASTGHVKAEDFAENQLGSPAARQQLIEQYSDADGYNLDARTISQGYSQTKGHPFYIEYYDSLFSNGLANSKGYPQNLRKVALVNGSLLGSKVFKNPFKVNHYDFNDNNALRDDSYANSGEQVLDLVGIANFVGVKIVGTRLHAYFMPEYGNYSAIAHFYRKRDPYYNITRSITNANFRGSMDNVPGGWFPTQQILAKTTDENKPSELSWFEKRKIEHVNSFIPVVSALGFKNPNFNWRHKFDRNLLCNNEIPFDSYFGPKINERHTSFTEESFNWFKAELAGNPQPPTVYLKDSDINGSDDLCASETKTYTIDACKISGTVNWQVSSSLQIISSTDHSVSVKPINSQVGEMGYARAVTSTSTIKKEVWVGKPNPNLLYFERMQASSPHTLIGGMNPIVITHGYLKQGITQYYWDMDASWSNFAPNGIFINIDGSSVSGPLDISVKATNACGTCGFSNPTTFTIIGGYYFRIYPNPATETLTIERESIASNRQVGKTKQEKSFYKLYNFNNSLLLEGEIENLKNITVSSLKKGMYILKIVSGKSSETHQIIIK